MHVEGQRMKRRSLFEIFLRTGRQPADGPEATEVKFNPWHDPEDGRFTFAGRGKHFGGRGSANSGRASGVRSVRPVAPVRAPSTKPAAPTTSRPTRQPASATASNPHAHLARSFRPRSLGANQNSATPLTNVTAAVERMRRETAAVRKPTAASKELVERFKRHMIPEENERNDVYLDSRGIPTVGIGHRVVPSDKLKVGDRISDARKEEFWKEDSAEALQAAQQQMKAAGITEPNFVIPLASVNFQLGKRWYEEHKKTWGLIVSGDYEAAAREAEDSDWYKQTPDRVDAFQRALLVLPSKRERKRR